MSFNNIPAPVSWAAKKLIDRGFQTVLVGGCVRDSLIGRIPSDWDMATSASPDDMKAVFRENRLIETGLKHGTVTLLKNHMPIEITTFRKDGEYIDNRRPSFVEYTKNLSEDLKRRDFTINAMAFDMESRELVDLYGGKADLQAGIIRCVGNPSDRFSEDALRILRAIRFASRYNFRIDVDTAKAIHSEKLRLAGISKERHKAELDDILMEVQSPELLIEYSDVLVEIIPEIMPMIGMNQQNIHHSYDLWEHTLNVIISSPKNLVIRWAALFHDIGKPETFRLGSDGQGHFYGHASVGCGIARRIMENLKFDRKTMDEISLLIRHHDGVVEETSRAIKRKVNVLGEAGFRNLIKLQRADNLGQNPKFIHRQKHYDNLENLLNEMLRENEFVDVKTLEINGYDLIERGLLGKDIGHAIDVAFEAVISEEIGNSKAEIIRLLENKKLIK